VLHNFDWLIFHYFLQLVGSGPSRYSWTVWQLSSNAKMLNCCSEIVEEQSCKFNQRIKRSNDKDTIFAFFNHNETIYKEIEPTVKFCETILFCSSIYILTVNAVLRDLRSINKYYFSCRLGVVGDGMPLLCWN
jgi:hypothetical protein